MKFQIILPKSVQKELDRLPDDVASRILARLAGLETNPSATNEKSTVDKMRKEIFNLTKIGHRFLVRIKEIVDIEEDLTEAKN